MYGIAQTAGRAGVLAALERGGQVASDHVSDVLRRLSISNAEARALAHLVALRRMTVADLRVALGLRPSTLTGVLDRLEERGLLARTLNPFDRRSLVIDLTDAGERAGRQIADLRRSLEGSLQSRVRAADLPGFFAVLAAVEGWVPQAR